MRWLRPGYALVLTLLVTAPLLRPGYLLLRDAVSTPRSYLTDSALGLVTAPRANPQDFAVAVFSHAVDGGVVVKALLVAGLWLAGWGAARLAALFVPQAGISGQLVAATLAVWNPYVGERMLQGHWSLLVGYGCLPWAAITVAGLRARESRWWTQVFRLVFWVALAGLTPTGLILAATVGFSCVFVPGRRPRRVCAPVVGITALAAALPWLVAAMLGATTPGQMWAHTPDVGVFAARAEPLLGTLGSLASLGGIWNADAVPVSRATSFAVVSTGVLFVLAGLGVAALRWRQPTRPLLMLAAVSVLACAAMATGPGVAALHGGVEALPCLGVLRDGQKWVALAMPGYAVAGAAAVVTLRRWLPAPAAAMTCCAAVLLAMPDMIWGIGGKMHAVRYPGDWQAVATAINRAPAEVAVLPADSMRQFRWAGPAPVLDPLPRWLRADVLTTGDLTVSGTTVFGEGDRARTVQQLLVAGGKPDELRAAGVGWVVVERSPGDTGSAATTLARLPVDYAGPDLTLYHVGGGMPGASAARRATVIAAHLVWLAMLVGGAVGAVVTRRSDHATHTVPGSD